MNGKTIFRVPPADDERAKNICEHDKSSADDNNCRRPRSQLGCASDRGRYKVPPRGCPTNNNEQAVGGEIVEVKRESDPDGRWNYGVVVRTSGKEWGFEVDPNRKFQKKHTEIKR